MATIPLADTTIAPSRWRALIAVSRVEFMPGGLFFVFASAALACGSWSAMRAALGLIIAGLVVWYLSHLIGSQVNCLADVESDRMDKARLTTAVGTLGRGAITVAIVVEAVAALALAGYMGVRTGRPVLPFLWLAGFLLAVGYSVEPLRLKRRGWLNPVCLMLVLYALPMAFGYVTLAAHARWAAVGLMTATAAQMLALILLNPAADTESDSAAGIVTPCTRYGLRVITPVAAVAFGIGTVAAAVFVTELAGAASPARLAGLALAGAGQVFVLQEIVRLASATQSGRPSPLLRRNAIHFALLGITFAAVSGLVVR